MTTTIMMTMHVYRLNYLPQGRGYANELISILWA